MRHDNVINYYLSEDKSRGQCNYTASISAQHSFIPRESVSDISELSVINFGKLSKNDLDVNSCQ